MTDPKGADPAESGQIHAAWRELNLGSCCQIVTGRRDVNEGDPRGKYPFFTCSRTHTFSRSYSFYTEAIMVAGNGDVGNLNYYAGKFEAYQRTYVLHNFRLNSRYIWQQLNFRLVEHLGLGKIGSSIPYIRRGDLEGFSFSAPQNQETILQIVSALAAADDLIATLERSLVKRQAVKQGLMQQLLTGRTRLPGFDGAWREVTLGDVAGFSKGAGLPKSALDSTGSVPCIHYGELFTYYGAEIHNVASRTNPTGQVVASEDLDVLMPTSDVTPRGLAKASAIHGRGVVLGGDILVIRPESQHAYGPFIAHAIRLDADQVLQLVRGSTVYHLYASDMRNFRLFLPVVEEQQAITDVLRDAEREIESLHSRLVKASAVKTGMMQQLLTGRTRLPVEVES